MVAGLVKTRSRRGLIQENHSVKRGSLAFGKRLVSVGDLIMVQA